MDFKSLKLARKLLSSEKKYSKVKILTLYESCLRKSIYPHFL
jgi:hypothetical protein